MRNTADDAGKRPSHNSPAGDAAAAAFDTAGATAAALPSGINALLRRIKSLGAFAWYPVIGYRPLVVPAEVWGEEYVAGEWHRLGRLDRLGGFASILAYVQFFSPLSILDVGCGAGILERKLSILDYRSYLGIDLSPQAIVQARSSCADGRARFVATDAVDFATDEKFDLIIFNQCVYYFSDPRAVVARYASFLSPTGRMIVSCVDSGRNRAAWSAILKDHDVEDSMTIAQAGGRTITKVIVPKRRSAPVDGA